MMFIAVFLIRGVGGNGIGGKVGTKEGRKEGRKERKERERTGRYGGDEGSIDTRVFFYYVLGWNLGYRPVLLLVLNAYFLKLQVYLDYYYYY